MKANIFCFIQVKEIFNLTMYKSISESVIVPFQWIIYGASVERSFITVFPLCNRRVQMLLDLLLYRIIADNQSQPRLLILDVYVSGKAQN